MMTEEEKLAKAYFVLGLEPGAPIDKIMRRHRRLTMVWHPDRFPTDEGKKDAEEELKEINIARDDLTSHFEKNHRGDGACACKPTVGAASKGNAQSGARSGPGPGPGKRKTTQESNREEEEAERRSKERQQQAAQEAAEKEHQKQEAASAAAVTQAAQPANQQTTDLAKLFEDEQLRWKIARYIGAAWIGLSVFGWLGTTIRLWLHH